MCMKPVIALFLHQPKCSVQSGNGIMKALESKYRFKIFTKHSLEDDFFDDVDIVAIPGGFGDANSYDFLMKENAPRIKQFIKNGGRYLGICMGAYWAGNYYMDILKDIKAYQYIRRPRTDTRRPHAKAIDITWQGQTDKMYFYDGPALVGNGNFETVATYANGDAMALYQDRIGLIGCHPESDVHWYQSYPYMLKHWHEYKHHDLLLDFVDNLMKR